MLKQDIEFANRFKSDIKIILSNVCGFDYNSAQQIFVEAQVLEEKVNGLKRGGKVFNYGS